MSKEPIFGMDITTLGVRNFNWEELCELAERLQKHGVTMVRVFAYWPEKGLVLPYKRVKTGILKIQKANLLMFNPRYRDAMMRLREVFEDGYGIKILVSFQDNCGKNLRLNPWKNNIQGINLFYNTSIEAIEYKKMFFDYLFDMGFRYFEYINEGRHPQDSNKSIVKDWARKEVIPIAEHMKARGIALPLYVSSQGENTGHKIVGVLTEEASFKHDEVCWVRHALALPIDVYDDLYDEEGIYKYSSKKPLAISDDGVQGQNTGRKVGTCILKNGRKKFCQMHTRDRIAVVRTVKAISEAEGSPFHAIFFLSRSIDMDHISNIHKDLDLMIYKRILKRVYGVIE